MRRKRFTIRRLVVLSPDLAEWLRNAAFAARTTESEFLRALVERERMAMQKPKAPVAKAAGA